MRRKRLIRPPMPGCSLELMSDNSHCEVQVRVQDDLGGLLIASDDALGSPILASQACFNCAGDDGAAESHIPDPSQSQAAKSSVAPSSTSSSYHTKACEGSTRMDVTDTHAVSGHNNNNKVHGGNKDGLRSGPVSTHCSNTTRKGGLALGCDAVGEAASSLSSSSYAPNKATMGTRHHGNSLTISTSVAHHTTPCAKDFDRGGLVGGPPRGDGVTRSTGTSSTLSSRGMMPQRGSAGALSAATQPHRRRRCDHQARRPSLFTSTIQICLSSLTGCPCLSRAPARATARPMRCSLSCRRSAGTRRQLGHVSAGVYLRALPRRHTRNSVMFERKT